jgi:exopolyphosphatase/guanosine-5'-triphosphate,3'-diphosphate pyrophosphatase
MESGREEGGGGQEGRGQRIAVVDLGTNTTRLLVCEVRDGSLRELDRRTKITRLGEGLDESGRLTDAARERVSDALAEYRAGIDELGATRAVAVATSAIREAENGPAFRDELTERFSLEIRTITGEEEARLTFHGATSGRRSETRGEVLVFDIGGGSTEFMVGNPGADPGFVVSTGAGSVRQTERHLHDDPPGHEQVHALAEEIRTLLASGIPEEVREAVNDGIAVAGTATSLAAISQELDPYDPDRVHGYRLELGEGERILAMLAAMPLAERRDVAGLHPDRAPTIVAGALILVEATRAFGLDWVETSEADLLHGAALEAAEPGRR